MIFEIDNDDGIIKIGSPPEDLPGIVESVKVNNSLLMERKELQGQSGKSKEIQGWDDIEFQITLSLIDHPNKGITRWDYLDIISGVFRKVTDEGTPEIYTLSHPMLNAWKINQLLFSSLESTESRTRRKITVLLTFVEYKSRPGIIQERQNTAKAAEANMVAEYSAPPVSDSQRRGLGRMEERYGRQV